MSHRIHQRSGDIRLVARLADFLVDTGTTTVDSAELGCHDCLDGSLFLDVASESWYLRDDYDNLVE